MRYLLSLAAAALLLPAGLRGEYPGHGCIQQGTVEACMSQLSSATLYTLFPAQVIDPSYQWHRFLVSILTQDPSVEAFTITLTHESDGKHTTATQSIERWRDARGPWTSVAFFAPPGARFVAIRIVCLRPTESIEAP